MAKSPITKTANIILPLVGIGAVVALGFAVYTKFFKGQTDEQVAEEQVRQEKGAIRNTLDFLFGEPSGESQSQQVTPNPQTQNTTKDLDGSSSFFGDFFKGIGQFLFPTQEGQSSPTTEKDATDSTPSTTDASGTSTAKDKPTPKPDEVIPPTGGKNAGTSTPPRPAFVDSSLRDLQKNRQTFFQRFGQKPKRGGRINFGATSQKNPGKTTSNKDTSTQRKSTPSQKQVSNITAPPSKLATIIQGFSNKPAGTSRTSSKSSGSPTSSTSTTDKPKSSTPKTTGRRSGNTRTTNSGTGTTDKTQTAKTTTQVRRKIGRRRLR